LLVRDQILGFDWLSKYHLTKLSVSLLRFRCATSPSALYTTLLLHCSHYSCSTIGAHLAMPVL
jgi:hypothetical protein